jgi:hypothetical protein
VSEPIAHTRTADEKLLVLWSDGAFTWGFTGTIVKGSPRATTPEQAVVARDAGWLVLGDASIYDAVEIPALIQAAREVVAKGSRLPGDVRARFASREKRGKRLTPSWTVMEADRDGRPRVRVWVLPRLAYGGLAVWDDPTAPGAASRGRYQVMREIAGSRGTYEPTGMDFHDLDALSDFLREVRR